MTDRTRRALYPEIEPHDHGMLEVSGGHSLYYEVSGNPAGKPVIFLHGGPGSGGRPAYRRLFDPAAWRIVLFDQRGCGRSTPHAGLDNNTTWYLVADMERLRGHLGIERWMVFGGSWGSTLGLTYAESHPERVSELVVRGIFMVRPKELEWLYQSGANAIYPDAWEGFVAPIPEAERDNLMAAYYRRLTGGDETVRLAAAKAWSVWEAAASSLYPSAEKIAEADDDAFAIAHSRIECHYFVNKGFFESADQLLRDVGRIRAIPGVIVQGRYDVVCPMITAWDLHRAWPEADFRIVPDAGHAFSEPGIVHELIEATDRFRG